MGKIYHSTSRHVSYSGTTTTNWLKLDNNAESWHCSSSIVLATQVRDFRFDNWTWQPDMTVEIIRRKRQKTGDDLPNLALKFMCRVIRSLKQRILLAPLN